jgi:hypothetical protein
VTAVRPLHGELSAIDPVDAVWDVEYQVRWPTWLKNVFLFTLPSVLLNHGSDHTGFRGSSFLDSISQDPCPMRIAIYARVSTDDKGQ